MNRKVRLNHIPHYELQPRLLSLRFAEPRLRVLECLNWHLSVSSQSELINMLCRL
jgi:hypothetical protein